MSDDELKVWSSSEFVQLGDFEHLEGQFLTPTFMGEIVKVRTVKFFNNHMCFSIPNKGHLVVRWVKHGCLTENWSLSKQEYARLLNLKKRGNGEWEHFLGQLRPKRVFNLNDINEAAVDLCQRLLSHCAKYIDSVEFMDVSFTQKPHQALILRIIKPSVDLIAPTKIYMAVFTEFDQWLANFAYQTKIFEYPTELMSCLFKKVKEIHGVSRYCLPIFWEPLNLDICAVHFSASWLDNCPEKVQIKVKKLIIEDADEYFLNRNLINKMGVDHLSIEFFNRQCIQREKNISPMCIKELSFKEEFFRPDDFTDYVEYFDEMLKYCKDLNKLDFFLEYRDVFNKEFLHQFAENFASFHAKIHKMPKGFKLTGKIMMEIKYFTQVKDPQPILDILRPYGASKVDENEDIREYTFHFDVSPTAKFSLCVYVH